MDTRTFYDPHEAKEYTIKSTKPLRFIMDPHTSTRYLEHPNQFSVDQDTKLRQAPTRLNENDYATTSLYGTAPFKGRNDGPVDVESYLFHGQQNDTCNKRLVENSRHDNPNLQYGIPLKTIDDTLYKSSRNDNRNSYFRKSTLLYK